MADLEHMAGTEQVGVARGGGAAFGADTTDIADTADAALTGDARAAADSVGGRSRTLTDRLARAPWPTAAAAGALVALSTAVQLWFTPFLVGLAFGAVLRHRQARTAAGLVASATAAGWALPLVVRAVLGQPVLGIARVTAGLAGLPAIGFLTVLITLLIAVLQGLAGVWFARAVASLRRS